MIDLEQGTPMFYYEEKCSGHLLSTTLLIYGYPVGAQAVHILVCF